MEASARKILIRVVGAPILLAALGLVLYRDYRAGTDAGARWLVAAVIVVSAWEFYGLCAKKGVQTAWIAALVCLAVENGAYAFFRTNPWLVLHAFVNCAFFAYVSSKLVFRHGRFTVEAAALTLAGYVYVGRLREVFSPLGGSSLYWLLFLLAANKGSDMAAYVTGKLVGRHKMTPVLSPNKTWEGAAGGMIAGTVLGFLVLDHAGLCGLPGWALLSLAAVVTMAAQVGDLVESAFKRWAGAKDSGRFLPEFGGMLDMVDSFLVSAPVAHGVLLLYSLCVLGA